jgi:hypothetical protein
VQSVLSQLGEKLPVIKGPQILWNGLGIALIVTGVTFGIFSAVRSGSIFLSVGTAVITYSRFTRPGSSAKDSDEVDHVKRRTIELIIPAALCITLFVLSLTLPHAK